MKSKKDDSNMMLPFAAILGDELTVRNYFNKFPNKVHTIMMSLKEFVMLHALD